ncbi:MAG: S-methyl-5-thioribose-1-phosphate isomerase [Smithellaceae bacterium]|jgi:methylthioribose-1-phosphate isomerase
MIKTIVWKNNSVILIDQKILPVAERYVTCRRYQEIISAIKDLTVRGAPAIGVAAAMGAALGALRLGSLPAEKFRRKFIAICNEIARARPTARNLFWALERMKKRLDQAVQIGQNNLVKELVDEAKSIYAEDIEANRQIGKQGSKLLADGNNILTHCNAGALATAGYGTALGVIRAAHEQGKKLHIYVDETRPVLQGARLTAWELKKEKIPATVITDNMAGFLMKQGKIDKVLVGADRIAANGDTANKIGTYSLAVLAAVHRIPFYVAAPLSTIDVSLKTGAAIPIEERKSEEVTCLGKVRIAPQGIKVYNPAFDITPAEYITAIITEKGILTKPYRVSITRMHKGEKRS